MSGDRALLFTDIVDSTRLNDALGDAAMEAIWRRHDAVSRELIAKWQGQEIARSDGFFVVFDACDEALGFAADYHAAVAALHPGMQARVGVHAGPVEVVENSAADRARGAPAYEVYGVALPTAARVMSAAEGGQTLTTATVVRGARHNGACAKAIGHWRLKGIGDVVELYAVVGAGQQPQPPSDSPKAYRVVRGADGWMPARQVPNNLPADRDAFVGRASAVGELAKLLDEEARLVTLLGLGGIGKTRLALRYARTWMGDYTGGAWFCDLAAARNADDIVGAVGSALGIPFGRADPVQQIGVALAGRGPCLVILDNFEQVVDHAEATVGKWLAAAPEAKFLVTSRIVLSVVGEHVLVLPPLPMEEAMELFRRRATSAAGRAAIEERDPNDIRNLVELLDRLPLAIELAAARTRVVSPTSMLARIQRRFDLLASERGRPDRQATLRATLDWSWELLTESERVALSQLSIFLGGFTLGAFEAIVVSPGGTPASANVLQSLVEKSLVRDVGAGRFDLLISVREYAAERLEAMDGGGALRSQSEARHGAFYSAWHGQKQAAFARTDLDNILIACRRAIARSASDDAVDALTAAWEAIRLQGPIGPVGELVAAIRAVGSMSDRSEARLCRIAGGASFALGRVADARAEIDRGLSFAMAAGDRIIEIQLRTQLGDACAQAGQSSDAFAHFDSALANARLIDAPGLECVVLNSLGSLELALGRLDAAFAHYEAAHRIAKAAGNRRWEAGSLGNLAQVNANKGNYAEAERLYIEAISLARELHDRRWEGNARCNLGIAYLSLGKLVEARAELDLALETAREIGQRRLEAVTLCNLGLVADATSDAPEARRAFESAIAVAKSSGDRRSEGQFLIYLGALDTRERYFERARERLSQAVQLLEEVSDDLTLGLALCHFAEMERKADRVDIAGTLQSRAEHIAAKLQPESTSEFGVALARAREQAR